MCAALGRVDVVREAVRRLDVAVVPLQRDLDHDAVALAGHEDRLFVHRRLVLVQELDELADPALVDELVAPAVALVFDRDRDAGVEERELAQALRERLEAELGRLEHLGVGLERDLGAPFFGAPGDRHVGGRLAALVPLLVHFAVAPDLELEPLGERVDDRHADAVETAGDLVRRILELAAGVEDRQHDLRGRTPALVHVHGDPAAVVDDRDRVVDVDRDRDVAAEPGERLVDRVVHDLVDEVVQTGGSGGPDVHRRPLADGLEAFQNLDFVGAVVVGRTVRSRHAHSGRAATVGFDFSIGH